MARGERALLTVLEVMVGNLLTLAVLAGAAIVAGPKVLRAIRDGRDS